MYPFKLPSVGVAANLPDNAWQSLAKGLAERDVFVFGQRHQLPVSLPKAMPILKSLRAPSSSDL